MQLTMRTGAVIGVAALAACSQSGQDNSAAMNANSAAATEETVLPADESSVGADTLGNQLNQLNESGAHQSSETTNQDNGN
jgi:hypothetical protein